MDCNVWVCNIWGCSQERAHSNATAVRQSVLPRPDQSRHAGTVVSCLSAAATDPLRVVKPAQKLNVLTEARACTKNARHVQVGSNAAQKLGAPASHSIAWPSGVLTSTFALEILIRSLSASERTSTGSSHLTEPQVLCSTMKLCTCLSSDTPPALARSAS